MLKSIHTDNAALPLGHYSQAIQAGDTLYISGQLPIDPKDLTAPIGDIQDQTIKTLNNLIAVANAAGFTKENIAKVTIFISDISLWAEANTAYARFFGDHKPARSAVPVKDLPRGFQIEIEAIAVK